MGTDVRAEVLTGCVTSVASPDDAASPYEKCVHQGCADACAKRTLPHGFEGACVETCRETGVCATSADCGLGHECVAVAPRVRRCESRR